MQSITVYPTQKFVETHQGRSIQIRPNIILNEDHLEKGLEIELGYRDGLNQMILQKVDFFKDRGLLSLEPVELKESEPQKEPDDEIPEDIQALKGLKELLGEIQAIEPDFKRSVGWKLDDYRSYLAKIR